MNMDVSKMEEIKPNEKQIMIAKNNLKRRELKKLYYSLMLPNK